MLQCVEEIKLLRVQITNNINFNKFISKKTQVCNFKLRNLVLIKDSLPFKSRIVMVTNLISNVLDYCNYVLAWASENELNPLQLMLNQHYAEEFKVWR